MTEAQIVALEKAKADKEAHGEFESECPGYCGAQDTFYVGTLKGVGRVYQQTVIDKTEANDVPPSGPVGSPVSIASKRENATESMGLSTGSGVETTPRRGGYIAPLAPLQFGQRIHLQEPFF